MRWMTGYWRQIASSGSHGLALLRAVISMVEAQVAYRTPLHHMLSYLPTLGDTNGQLSLPQVCGYGYAGGWRLL